MKKTENLIDQTLWENIESGCESIQRFLPNEMISFNPSDPQSVDRILSKYGPEGAWEIAEVLQNAARFDMDSAMADSLEG